MFCPCSKSQMRFSPLLLSIALTGIGVIDPALTCAVRSGGKYGATPPGRNRVAATDPVPYTWPHPAAGGGHRWLQVIATDHFVTRSSADMCLPRAGRALCEGAADDLGRTFRVRARGNWPGGCCIDTSNEDFVFYNTVYEDGTRCDDRKQCVCQLYDLEPLKCDRPLAAASCEGAAAAAGVDGDYRVVTKANKPRGCYLNRARGVLLYNAFDEGENGQRCTTALPCVCRTASAMPSVIPSKAPSSQPSSIPTTAPSSIPSKTTSAMPSVIPSKIPSSQPSSIPTKVPSSIPSKITSAMPSVIPASKVPSSQPSSIPSKVPSSIPPKIDALWGDPEDNEQTRISIACPPLVVTRLDPIASPGESCSDHVHTVMGNRHFRSNITWTDMTQKHTTCNANNDFSSYWAPSLYHQDGNGIFRLVPHERQTMYYRTSKRGEPGKEFPRFFRMKGGNYFLDPTNPVIGENEMSYVIWSCARPKYKDYRSSYLDVGDDCVQLQLLIQFPDCIKDRNDIDGVTTGKYAYSDPYTRACPASHPVKLVHLQMNIFYNISGLHLTDLVLSNGDRTGKSMHGDFVSGWIEGALDSGVRSCLFDPKRNGRFHGEECTEADHKGTIPHIRYPSFYGQEAYHNQTFPEEQVEGVAELPRGVGNC